MILNKTQSSLLAALTFTLTACGGSSSDSSEQDNTGAANNVTAANYSTLDASMAPAYLDLASGHNVAANEEWHISYQKYVGFSINSDAGIEACVAKQYEALYDANDEAVKAEFSALTRNNTENDFNNVQRDDCTDFTSDQVESQFTDWYTYNSTTHVITVNSDDSNGWIVRSSTADANGNYAYTRLKATAYDRNGMTFSSELWDNNSQSFLAAQSTDALSPKDGTVYWNMEDNSTSTTEFSGWDLKIEAQGYASHIYVNGGASGSGDAGVGSALRVANVDAVTDPTSTQQVYKYFGDSASGPLSSPGDFGPFEYGVGGDNHDMWPTFAVYILKSGERYFKAQVVSNKGEDGTQNSGTLYIRHQEIIE